MTHPAAVGGLSLPFPGEVLSNIIKDKSFRTRSPELHPRRYPDAAYQVSLYNINAHKHWVLRDQPWRCLCFGFSQMIRILPFLLITLHFSQIGFTDDLTFMTNPPFLSLKLNFPCVYGIFGGLVKNPRTKVLFYSIALARIECKQNLLYFLPSFFLL